MLPGAQDDLQIIADIDDDAQLEFVERIVVRLAQSNAPDTYATIVIDDNEQALQWTETDIQVNESDENAVLTVELLRSTEKDASVAYTIKPITAFFGNGNDYLLERGSIDIATGQTLAVLNIPIYQDNFEEPTETFMVTLFDPTNANLGEQTVSIVTINDDDATEPPSPIVPPVAAPSSSGGTVGLAWLFLLYFGITRRFGKH